MVMSRVIEGCVFKDHSGSRVGGDTLRTRVFTARERGKLNEARDWGAERIALEEESV